MNTTTKTLRFKKLDINATDVLIKYLPMAHSRTCDYTLAGILMWTDYFRYEYAVADNTLFIKGMAENDLSLPAFSLPIGQMPVEESVELLKSYCGSTGNRLLMSAIPADCVEQLMKLGATSVQELTDWADYLYNASDLALLEGKRFNKKRNHVNRFCAENPGWELTDITPVIIPDIIKFYTAHCQPSVDDHYVTAVVEHDQTLNVLRNYARMPFEGAVLKTPTHGIVAFTIGEVIGDTLFVHIEKMRHDIPGAGETINKYFAERMLQHHAISFINREEDVGDAGLRAAKLSYHPCMMLKKYNIQF